MHSLAALGHLSSLTGFAPVVYRCLKLPTHARGSATPAAYMRNHKPARARPMCTSSLAPSRIRPTAKLPWAARVRRHQKTKERRDREPASVTSHGKRPSGERYQPRHNNLRMGLAHNRRSGLVRGSGSCRARTYRRSASPSCEQLRKLIVSNIFGQHRLTKM